MLSLHNIVKNYTAGDTVVSALKGVSLNFRKSEFVSVLGQSGCGKTTLLNIIGGLDRYTSGDLVINGRSTKDYSDRDWDDYRNHSIGFVFQSYNLIPHQSVLSNVELALTLSGVSREERRRRATEALERVGLGDQLHKKPNQMSGGQMQRVAIARALVNNPDILLADEPTGALDSETSVQIMEILKEISADKLIIMVTHNPELAEQYSTRIIRLLDGEVTDDSMLYEPEDEAKPEQTKKAKKAKKHKNSMSVFTAISLSFNNLLTKKARTFLTSFAGSIGIIGIALIMAVSEGVNAYIASVQEDMLSSYPITIQSESVDASTLMTTLMQADSDTVDHDLDKVYVNTVMYELVNSLNSMEVNHNNLLDFKKHIDSEMANSESELAKYATSIQYGYDLNMNILVKDEHGDIVQADVIELMKEIYGAELMGGTGSFMSQSFATMNIWAELLPENDGGQIADILKKQYDVIHGVWPEKYDEVVLIVDKNNEISDLTLYALGLKTTEQMKNEVNAGMNGEQVNAEQLSWSYEEMCGMTFRIVSGADMYAESSDGKGYTDLSETDAGMKYLYDNGTELKITGIIRPNEDASAAMLANSSIGYTKALTEYIVNKANSSTLVTEQLENPDIDVITGLEFKPETEPDDAFKASELKKHIATLDIKGKADMYKTIMATPDEKYLNDTAAETLKEMSREQKIQSLTKAFTQQSGMSETQISNYLADLDDATVDEYMTEAVKTQIAQQYAQGVMAQLMMLPNEQAAAMLESELESYDESKLATVYDLLLTPTYSESSYEENLEKLGYVDFALPSTINIYADTFEDKDEIAELIKEYNKDKDEADQINYTDYVALLMSSITVIINAISYVLIAFVSISLVVSSLMIGIITYISVLERTKEIGVLRSIGASKKDISRVFNAETFIIGTASGVIGILVSLLLCIPINAIIQSLSGISTLSAVLPVGGALFLIAISIIFTLVAGLIPSRLAAKKDPVVALRTE